MGYLIIDDPERALPLVEALERYEPRRVNPPGAQTAYSNWATSLAGHLVERVSGIPFTDYLRQEIFEPLGMASASFVEPLPDALASRMADSYAVEAGRFVEKPFEIVASFAPGRSAVSSISTSAPAAPSLAYSSSVAESQAPSPTFRFTSPMSKGATGSGQTIPFSSWLASMMPPTRRETPTP